MRYLFQGIHLILFGRLGRLVDMRLVFIFVTGLTILCSAGSVAQETAGPVREDQSAELREPAKELKPPIYYLKDEGGNLVPVVGFDLEDFERLYRIKEGIEKAQAPPKYHISAFRTDGAVEGDYLRLSATVDVVTHVDGWVRFPLRLGNAVLTDPASVESSGSAFVRWSEPESSYVGQVLGKVDEVHQFRIEGLIQLEHTGEATSVTLDLPHTARSECVLTLPEADIVASATGTGVLKQQSTEQGTEFRLSGYRGPTVVSWRKKGLPAAHRLAVLECTGQVLTRLDENVSVTTAELTVQSLSVPFERFRVRLPKGSEFIEADSTDQTISCEPIATEGSETPVLEVRLERETVGPVKVRLSAKQTRDVEAGGATWFELSGFDVVDAVRQSGQIAVETAGNRYLVRGPSHGVHQVDEIPKSLAREDVVAAFEYFSRPCSLTARVTARNARIGVEPEYRLFVEADRIRLEAVLAYTIRGTKAHSLELDLAGWEFDSVGPEGAVAADGVEMGADGLLSIPLVEPVDGRVEITVRAHLPIDAGAAEIIAKIPAPKANSPAPASVVVLPAENVEVTPNSEKTVGLVLQQSPPPVRLPDQRKNVFFYRTESGPQWFCAGFRVHRREIKLDVEHQLFCAPDECRVWQTFSFDVAYEPLDRLVFHVPPGIPERGRPRFFLEGEEVKASSGQEVEKTAAGVEVRLALPEPRLGEFEMEVRYAMPEVLAPKSSVERAVPLVRCADAIPISNRLSTSSTDDVLAVLHDENWKEDRTDKRPGAAESGVFQAAGAPAEAVLRLSREEDDAAGRTVVDKAWIQTRLTHALRQDRACFRFTTRRGALELVFPSGVVLDEARLLLDGVPATWRKTREDRAIVTVPPPVAKREPEAEFGRPPQADKRTHLIEVEYRFSNPRDGRGAMRFEFPRFAGDVWVRCAYWQLVLPRDEDVVWAPGGWVHEYRWAWQGAFEGRSPILEQPDLEAWVDTSKREAPPAETNRYLFSAVGRVDPCEFVTAPRALTVLILSGAVLVGGLCFIYVPSTRNPAVFLLLAIAGSVAGVLHPEAALLGLQAAAIGFGLALVAMFLARLFAVRRGTVVIEPSSSILGSDSTKTQFPTGHAAADSSGPVVSQSSSQRGSAL